MPQKALVFDLQIIKEYGQQSKKPHENLGMSFQIVVGEKNQEKRNLSAKGILGRRCHLQNKKYMDLVQCCSHVILEVERLRQEHCKLEASKGRREGSEIFGGTNVKWYLIVQLVLGCKRYQLNYGLRYTTLRSNYSLDVQDTWHYCSQKLILEE